MVEYAFLKQMRCIIDTREKQCTGPHAYTTPHINKTVNVYKIKHISIAFVLPTKSIGLYELLGIPTT
jgi:hypothetical protein